MNTDTLQNPFHESSEEYATTKRRQKVSVHDQKVDFLSMSGSK
jgi:hypothetical protein